MKEKRQRDLHKPTLNHLFSQLRQGRVSDRVRALESLARIHHPIVINEITRALSDKSPTVRAAAVEYLGMIGAKDAVGAILSQLDDSAGEVRMMAASSLGALLQGESSPPELISSLEDPDELVRIEAAESLGAIGDRRALTALWTRLDDRSSLVRSYAAGAIGELGSKKDAVRLKQRLDHERSDTAKVGYYQALFKLGEHNVLDQLLYMLSHSKDYRVRCAVSMILSDVVKDKNMALVIRAALQKALRQEPTIAAKSSIRSSILQINERFDGGRTSRPRGRKGVLHDKT